MDIVQEKKWIKSELDNIDDERIILAVKSLIEHSRLKDELFSQLTVEELKRRALQSEKDIKEGNVISLEDLEKESQNW